MSLEKVCGRHPTLQLLHSDNGGKEHSFQFVLKLEIKSPIRRQKYCKNVVSTQIKE